MKQRRFILRGVLGMAALLAAAWLTPGAATAEVAVPTSLDAADATMYLGKWSLNLEFNEREIELILDVVDLDGKVGATIDSARQPEPQAVEEIVHQSDGSAIFTYNMPFGQQSFTMNLHLKYSAGRMDGTIADTNGIFSAEVHGFRADDARIAGNRPNPTEAKLNVSGKKVRITFVDLDAGSEDYTSLMSTENGNTFWFVGGRATKLYTDLDLAFGETVVKAHNVAEDYPGVYSLWLKKSDAGWSLVFNSQPDIWGTQHKSEYDVAEIALTAGALDEQQKAFLVNLEEANGVGKLRIAWGANEWTTDFKVLQPAEQKL